MPADTDLIPKIMALVKEKKMLKPKIIVVIGIGGSNLGTMAIQQALYGQFYNEQDPDIKVYYADTVDSDYILDILLLVEQELQKGNQIILNVVSKSGKTTETIANFEVFLHMLKSYRPNDYKKYIAVTTDQDSPLWKLAQEENFSCLSIPKNVGGRYSVFSAVGLFPLAMIGIDIEKLQTGAGEMVDLCLDEDVEKNPAATTASILYTYYKKGIYIHDMFFFSVDLYALGMWYRQLLAESIGKQRNLSGDEVNVGITPTISIGSTDLHSMTQLRLGGPNNTLTTFVSVLENKSNVPVPCLKKFEKLVASIQCKSLSSIMDSIFEGVKKAYTKKKRAFMTIELPEKSERYIGQFMQMQMMTIIYLGYLLDINPFDQPHVELYKQETRKLLSDE